MPFVRKYSGVKKGGIVFTGNTPGLSKAAGTTAPGTEGSIGAFASTDKTLKVGAFPPEPRSTTPETAPARR